MRVLVQRVKEAAVTINGERCSAIGPGLLIFLGIEEADSGDDIGWLAAKVVNLRLFDDSNGVMNLSAAETGKEIMIVSQFTLHASTKKGNRPSYIRAAGPEQANPLYEFFHCPDRGTSGPQCKHRGIRCHDGSRPGQRGAGNNLY